MQVKKSTVKHTSFWHGGRQSLDACVCNSRVIPRDMFHHAWQLEKLERHLDIATELILALNILFLFVSLYMLTLMLLEICHFKTSFFKIEFLFALRYTHLFPTYLHLKKRFLAPGVLWGSHTHLWQTVYVTPACVHRPLLIATSCL